MGTTSLEAVAVEAVFPLFSFSRLYTCVHSSSLSYNIFSLQVILGTGCQRSIAFTLDYAGPFDCAPVVYLTGGVAGVVVLATVALVAVCKTRGRCARRKVTDTPPTCPETPETT